MHWWPRLPAVWRRRISIATSAAGIAFLVAAVQAEGVRESALISTVVVGPAVLTATASASASLYYYVLTAFCLLLGFAGLAFGEALSRWLVAASPGELRRGRVAGDRRALPAREERGARAPRPGDGRDLARSRRRRVLRDRAGAGWPGLRPLARAARRLRLPRARAAWPSWASSRHPARPRHPLRRVRADERPRRPDRARLRLRARGWPQVFWLVLVPQLVVWPVFTVSRPRGRGPRRRPAGTAGTRRGAARTSGRVRGKAFCLTGLEGACYLDRLMLRGPTST